MASTVALHSLLVYSPTGHALQLRHTVSSNGVQGNSMNSPALQTVHPSHCRLVDPSHGTASVSPPVHWVQGLHTRSLVRVDGLSSYSPRAQGGETIAHWRSEVDVGGTLSK